MIKLLIYSQNLHLGNEEYNFRVISCVVHSSFSSANPLESGHYVMWKRNKNGWLIIEDESCSYESNFVKNLSDILYMILERF